MNFFLFQDQFILRFNFSLIKTDILANAYIKKYFTKGNERNKRKENYEYSDLKNWLTDKKKLAEKVKGFPVLYDQRVKGFKEKNAAQSAWE